MKIISTVIAASAALAISAQVKTPGAVTDFHATWNDDGSCTLQLTAPATGYDADYNLVELTGIDRIDIARNHNHEGDVLVHSFTSPEPGAVLEWTDTDTAEGGQFVYTATVFVGGASDYGTSISVSDSQYPASVTDVKIWTNSGEAPVTISFTAPTIDIEGQPLKKLKRIRVERMNPDYSTSTVKSLTNVEPGGTYSVTDNNVNAGSSYFYTITPYTTDGQGASTTADIYVGEDVPGTVSITSAQEADNGVYLEWQIPEQGQRNGYIDPSKVTYTLQRFHGMEERVTIATDIQGNSYTDYAAIDVPEELLYTYVIAASNGVGTSYEATVSVAAGPAAQLPYSEGFDTPFYQGSIFDHETWTSDGWATNPTAYDYNSGSSIASQQGLGLAYIAYSTNSTLVGENHLTSGKISLQQASDPVLTFWYYVPKGTFDNLLGVEVADETGTYTELGCFTFGNNAGWQQAQVSLKDYCGQQVHLRFNSHKGTHSTIMAIDEVQILDQGASIHQINNDERPTHGLYNFFGQPADDHEGFVVQGGKIIIIK